MAAGWLKRQKVARLTMLNIACALRLRSRRLGFPQFCGACSVLPDSIRLFRQPQDGLKAWDQDRQRRILAAS